MKKKTGTTTTPAATAETLRVAYHQGPPEIGYFGATWRRGVSQPVTRDAWAAMQARGDFSSFDFRIEPATPAEQE
jgi:hypothetical protein